MRTIIKFMEGVDSIEQVDNTHTHWTISIAGVVTVPRLDDVHTRVTVRMDIDPDGFVENVADKLGVLGHRVQGDLDRFKKFIEIRDGHETGAWRGDPPRPAHR